MNAFNAYTIQLAEEHLTIHFAEMGPVATNGFLVADTKKGVASVFDVPPESKEFFLQTADALGVKISAIHLTHSHWDHTGDVADLRESIAEKEQREIPDSEDHNSEIPVFVHADDAYRLREPNKHTVMRLPFALRGAEPAGFYTHGEHVRVGDWDFEIRHTPGHTEGGVCFIEHARNLAIVGDTIFQGSVGRTDLPGGDTKTLIDSIHRELMPLPDDMTILPGHGSPSTIGAERATNPFL